MSKELPSWSSSEQSACQCRGHGFDPCTGKIPHGFRATKSVHHKKIHHDEKLVQLGSSPGHS